MRAYGHLQEEEKPTNKPEYWEDACKRIAEEIATLVISKQLDYGKKNILDFGEMGVLVRANDKMSRLRNLCTNCKEKPKNESIEDSWTDIAGYSILALMLRKNLFNLPFSSEVKNYD